MTKKLMTQDIENPGTPVMFKSARTYRHRNSTKILTEDKNIRKFSVTKIYWLKTRNFFSDISVYLHYGNFLDLFSENFCHFYP